MKIKSIQSSLHHLPLTKPYTIAYKTMVDTEIVLLEIALENGIIGLGAANPFEDVVGETPQQTFELLQGGYLDSFIGKDIEDFLDLITQAAGHFEHKPGAIAAIDIALHDLYCKYKGISVLDFYGKCMQALPTSITIGIKPVAEMLEEARGYKQLGFKILKIKTGLNVEEDIERVAKLSELFGNNMLIRVDANQGYNLENLRKFIHATQHLKLELIEQPLRVGEEAALLSLTASEQNMIVADESLINLKSAITLSAAPQPYGAFNIKLMKCGGIMGAKAIAGIAANAGIDLFWGCNDESIISITAALHCAYSCNNTKWLDLDGSFDIAKDLVEGGFQLKDGYMHPLGLPGLGLQKYS
jgi:L-alanine-DL-glutamate epimerase-like enolase superfamily enzyme